MKQVRIVKTFEGVLRQEHADWTLVDRRAGGNDDVNLDNELWRVEGRLINITLEYEE